MASRRRIHEFVGRNPGAHLREIARSLGLPLGTALYHLDFLSHSDFLVVRRDGRYKRFFQKHTLGRIEKDHVSAFHHAVPRRIVTILLTDGRRTQRELCDAVGVSRSTLSFHVGGLVSRGIVRCESRWPENLYSVADAGLATRVLVTYRESFGAPDEAAFEARLDGLARAVAAGAAPLAAAPVART